MKTHSKSSKLSSRTKSRPLTLGELIADTYRACGEQAPKLLQLAMDTQLVKLSQRPSY